MPLHLTGVAAAAAGLLVALLVLAVGVAAARRRRAGPPPADTAPEAPGNDPTRPHFLRLLSAGGERRRAARRKSAPLPAEASAPGWGGPTRGWLIDRSLAGVRPGLEAEAGVGWELRVSVRDGRGVEHVFRAEVIRCVRAGAGWEAGCRFAEPPPAEVTLMLG
jgi:hypothetical protein